MGILLVTLNCFPVQDTRLCFYTQVTILSHNRANYTKKSPIKQVIYYKEKVCSQLIPQIGESFDESIKRYGVIKTAVYFHNFTTSQAQEEFKLKDFSIFPVIGRDSLLKNKLNIVVPDNYINQSKYWQKDWTRELLFWLSPPFHTLDQGVPIPLTADQKKFAEPQSGHSRTPSRFMCNERTTQSKEFKRIIQA